MLKSKGKTSRKAPFLLVLGVCIRHSQTENEIYDKELLRGSGFPAFCLCVSTINPTFAPVGQKKKAADAATDGNAVMESCHGLC